ncbi:helix-turn-helix domain-containing protein [Alicyclobacillus fodiniaquatilis]|uniref:Helix-turn-helix domain-containing protein n=1 Tax=Alicyclobacillus fodiniaquatilis TaxID=1661150 RepID=A0ABW4JMD6_9BACL
MWGFPTEQTSHILNTEVRDIHNAQVAFHVHYWGMDNRHLDNLLHKHSFFEICYVVSGTGLYIDDGVQFALTDDTLFLSRPGVVHQIKSATGMELLFVAFDIAKADSSRNWVEQFERIKSVNEVVVSQAQNTVTQLIWQALVKAAGQARPAQSDTLAALGMSLLTSFPSAFEVFQTRGKIHPTRKGNPLLERAIQFIQDNLAHQLPLNDVADYLHVSSRHLSRLFKQTTGIGFNSFVQNERISYARQLLSETDHSIKDIALMTGFSSIHYFTRVFTNLSQVPPSAYRKQHRV